MCPAPISNCPSRNELSNQKYHVGDYVHASKQPGPSFQLSRQFEPPLYRAPSDPVVNVTRGFRRIDRELDAFFFAFALCSLATFMSFGAVVRSCLTCVGTSCGLPWVSEGQSQGALTMGTESRIP